MNRFSTLLPLYVLAVVCAVTRPAAAHDFRVGAIVIDHPYALPTGGNTGLGYAHLRTLKNTGDQPDTLLGATSSAAASVDLRAIPRASQGGLGAQVNGIVLPAHSETSLRHDGEWALVLHGLAAPLKPGDQFAMTLRFLHAGTKEVTFSVVQPRGTSAGHVH